jgi:hypothetical protein
MYVDTAETVLRGKAYYQHLLRDSYRKNGKYWHPIDISIWEGINELGSIRTVEITISNTTYLKIPTPTGLCKEVPDAADVKLPLTIPIKKYS